jgi:Peptidase M50B-like
MTHPPPLATMLSRIGEIQTPLPPPIALLLGILAFLVVNGRALWRVATHVNTVAHEGAHAMVGICAGRRIRSVTIDPNGGGGTAIAPASGFGFAVAVFVGYMGPSAAGLMAAWLISIGRIVMVLWLGLVLLAAMLLLVRNFFGGIVIVACGALLCLVVRYTTVGAQTAVAYGVTWFLLLSGPKAVREAGSKPKDATILAERTILWASAWSFLWLVGTIAALVAGGAILV